MMYLFKEEYRKLYVQYIFNHHQNIQPIEKFAALGNLTTHISLCVKVKFIINFTCWLYYWSRWLQNLLFCKYIGCRDVNEDLEEERHVEYELSYVFLRWIFCKPSVKEETPNLPAKKTVYLARHDDEECVLRF